MTDLLLNEQTAVLLTSGQPVPPWLVAWWDSAALASHQLEEPADVLSLALRARPRTIVLNARGPAEWQDATIGVCRRLKRDSYTAIVPVVMLVPGERFADAFAAGADEVLREGDHVYLIGTEEQIRRAMRLL